VEWGRAVARIHRQIVSDNFNPHFVLPDLKAVKNEIEAGFDALVPSTRKIRTIAVYKHSHISLKEHVRGLGESDHLLIVRGPEDGELSTPKAIELIKSITPDCKIWATANPNSASSPSSVQQKLAAGATGIITQPFLSSKAVSNFQRYPAGPLVYVAGLAFPNTLKSLLFWQELIGGVPDLTSDSLFQDHVRYFESNDNSPQQWVKHQLKMLKEIEQLNGVHYMPLNNTQGLLSILQEELC